MMVWIVDVLLSTLNSPPPETVAVLVSGETALPPTVATTVTGGYEPAAAQASARVQVRVTPLQDQPVPEMLVTVIPAGGNSRTVTRLPATTAPLPLLVTVSV